MMTDIDYGDLDLVERNAYQSGNIEVARLAAIALDAQRENEEYQTELDSRAKFKTALESIDDLICYANYRTGKKAELRKLIDAIIADVDEALA